jgi:hypothetical protein
MFISTLYSAQYVQLVKAVLYFELAGTNFQVVRLKQLQGESLAHEGNIMAYGEVRTRNLAVMGPTCSHPSSLDTAYTVLPTIYTVPKSPSISVIRYWHLIGCHSTLRAIYLVCVVQVTPIRRADRCRLFLSAWIILDINRSPFVYLAIRYISTRVRSSTSYFYEMSMLCINQYTENTNHAKTRHSCYRTR